MWPSEPEVLVARQAFPDAQEALAGVTRPYATLSASWYGTRISDERGSFALVREGGEHERLVGDRVLIMLGDRRVFAYVVGLYPDLATDIVITRRLWAAINEPAELTATVAVEVVV